MMNFTTHLSGYYVANRHSIKNRRVPTSKLEALLHRLSGKESFGGFGLLARQSSIISAIRL
jgi:hypothetical protein